MRYARRAAFLAVVAWFVMTPRLSEAVAIDFTGPGTFDFAGSLVEGTTSR